MVVHQSYNANLDAIRDFHINNGYARGSDGLVSNCKEFSCVFFFFWDNICISVYLKFAIEMF